MRRFAQILQLAELFDHIEHVLAWVKDTQYRFLWVNRAALLLRAEGGQAVSGEDAVRAILGKTDHDLCPAVLADQYRLDDDHVLAGNPIVNRIEVFRYPDGTTCWHVTNKIPLFNERGDVIGTAGIARWLDPATRDVVPGNAFGPVLAHIRDHYHAPLSNRQLARLANMSVRAFERKFQSCFHVSPQKYIRRIRLRIASHALVYTNQSIAEVALSSGFADQSHFTREFRRYFARTPRDYRAHYASGSTGHAARSIKSAVPDL
jgi:AraC-like DNA-binding protein